MSRFAARPPAGEELRAFDDLARREGELFQQPEWIEALCALAQRVGIFDKQGALVGGFVLDIRRRYGIGTLRNPPFTPSIGPFFERRATSPVRELEEARNVLEAVASFLEPGRRIAHVALSPRTADVLPFRWRDFKVVVEYTYQLDLAVPEPDMMAKYDGKLRNDIKKALKDGLEVTVGREFKEVGRLEAAALLGERAGGLDAMEAVLQFAESWPNSFTTCVRRGGDLLAGSLVLFHGPIAYYIMGGYIPGADGRGHHGAGPLSLHESINHARSLGCRVFDFEGSTIPRVEAFIRGFGGALSPYYSVSKAWLPIEMLLKLRWRKYF